MSELGRVRVAGLGGIGAAAGLRLRERGWRVEGIDPDEQRRQRWSAQARSAAYARPAEADWRGVSHLVVAVRTPAQVEAVLTACSACASPDLVVAVVTTLPVRFWDGVGAIVPETWRVLECPVTGGERPVREGTVTMLLHGPADARDRELLGALSGHLVEFPAAGQPALVKLLNNTLAAANVLAVARALDVAAERGIAVEDFLGALNLGTGRSHLSEHITSLSRNQYELLEKDVRLLAEDFPGVRIAGESTDMATTVERALGGVAGTDAVL